MSRHDFAFWRPLLLTAALDAAARRPVTEPRPEVLRLGFWDGEPFSLIPVSASPGTRAGEGER
ncbi:hypothetical protein [Actinoplanes sp. G11-F43]|uniref:hypothetical protein n=1 Tax=Actinoplanes sp. G11-F43 TaxID=3424130 RepID=UPI003D34E0AE